MKVKNDNPKDLLQAQKDFERLRCSKLFLKCVELAVGSCINVVHLLELKYVYKYSVQQLSVHFHTALPIVRDWSAQIDRIHDRLVHKNLL